MSLTVHFALVFRVLSLLWPSWSWFVAAVVCGRHDIGPSCVLVELLYFHTVAEVGSGMHWDVVITVLTL